MKELYDKVSFRASKMTTIAYSTSFSLGIRVFDRKFHDPVYGIYGFVRLADEIVDTFHAYDKERLLKDFRKDTHQAISDGISLNPVLNSFQHVVNKYGIERDLVDTFLNSMEMDLEKRSYDNSGYERYILGSAEVVGLMCLRVFLEGDDGKYQELKPHAMSLGSAFQKINFLRDLHADYSTLGRTYFPGVDLENFSETDRIRIEEDIERDFRHGYDGIKKLPSSAKRGVYIAYIYYYSLFKKIRKTPTTALLKKRVRIPDSKKYWLLVLSYFKLN
ncbi:MAG: phytoene/squalene synthase family protein [Marinilabiliales bacterium]|nr:MAG: phytoene/squalene synthase family protein [Marinilabiliales bacterium]